MSITIRDRGDLLEYQNGIVHFQRVKKFWAIWAKMGGGKTVSTLTAIADLQRELFSTYALIIAPLRVANTVWEQEAKQWTHLQHLQFSICTNEDAPLSATDKTRQAEINDRIKALILAADIPLSGRILASKQRYFNSIAKASKKPEGKWRKPILRELQALFRELDDIKARTIGLNKPADIYVINREQVKWLVEYYGNDWPFDMVVIDEASSFNDQGSLRFRAFRKVRNQIRRFGELTGSPAAEGLIKIWAPIFLLDRGKRLGRTITEYREEFFDYNKYTYKYTLKEGSKAVITEKIKDIVYVVNQYAGMPPVKHVPVPIQMSDKLRLQYDEFERDNLLALADVEIEAATAGALTNKLLQFANGAVYDEDKVAHHIHDLKIEALRDIVEDANGEPILVAYSFVHDLPRLQKAFPAAKTLSKDGREIPAWNRGEIPMLIVHPQSAGHGLNLQFGSHIVVWFGLTWSLEYLEQLNARLARKGQEKDHVVAHYLLVEGTWDAIVYEVTQEKARNQDGLIADVEAAQSEMIEMIRIRINEMCNKLN